ncbi:MAG: hypothetical protein AUG51_00980 [Acidobacteria bacterium 13_1_20CM_3_53_8]|nr:MAG: hypothetical protein AUG51_00980 [Acidobacteria bacterium 13_1_20CM_3_53_8]
MSEQPATVEIQAAAVSDRGLSEKRPLNEDSFLSDAQRGIFAVADGVGGAQAGEVASRTAMEVLDEAFRHQLEDADVEDLMEIAIQRANASIFQMSREHPKFLMMATTVVALHLDGHTATIGHVGDSRLYRVTPDGKIHRETDDHSMVEEEVRAGRMTPQQAANHPSRNVISRALGAEDTVEVDLKIVEIEDATTFLLCSDGITRHIQDRELEAILNRPESLEQICEEMKRRCYDRGAEDNLTAVVVHVGQRRAVQPTEEVPFDEERTVQFEKVSTAAAPASASAIEAAAPITNEQAAPALQTPRGVDRLMDAQPAQPAPMPPQTEQAAIPASTARGGAGRTFGLLLALLILLVAIGAAAFYGGLQYHLRLSRRVRAILR